jgi:predicted nucleic acid-binding protein
LPDKATDRLVIDASAAVNAALVDDAFTGWQTLQVFAPSLLWSEATSALSQMRWRGELSAQEASVALERLVSLPIKSVASQELLGEALTLANELGWAKTYDAEYCVLTLRLNARLLTVDARLAAGLRSRINVVSPAAIERELTG